MIVQKPDGRLVIVHMQERSKIQAQKSDLCPPAPTARIGGHHKNILAKNVKGKSHEEAIEHYAGEGDRGPGQALLGEDRHFVHG